LLQLQECPACINLIGIKEELYYHDSIKTISAKANQEIYHLIHPAKAGRNSWLPIIISTDIQDIGN